MTKCEVFFSLRISHPRSGNYCVCDGVYTHSVSHAHFSDTFSLRDVQTSGTRMAHGVCSAHVISLHLALSGLTFHPPSLLTDFDILDFLAELFPTRKRGSSALPHERRGVWLLGRSHALHTLSPKCGLTSLMARGGVALHLPPQRTLLDDRWRLLRSSCLNVASSRSPAWKRRG